MKNIAIKIKVQLDLIFWEKLVSGFYLGYDEQIWDYLNDPLYLHIRQQVGIELSNQLENNI